MIQTVRKAWAIPELKKKIVFTLLILLIFRIGNAITVPYIDVAQLEAQLQGMGATILGLYNVMSGGAFATATVFALSIQPYINSSIIIQLLTVAIPALERMGVKVIVLRSLKTYVELFTGRVTRGQRKGMVRSFPLCGKCYVQRDCKVRPIERYRKTLPAGTVQYVGIAQDEQERLLRLEGSKQVSLLDKYNFTEQDAWEFCRKAGLLSPVYAFTDRGGCWFCPNAKRAELRHLYDHHPDLWARMLELQAIPGKATEKFNRTQKFSDIDVLFRQEDGKAALRQAA